MTVNVLLADDQDIVRAALRMVIDRRPGLRVVADAKDGRQAVDRAYEMKPDVVVMDVRMPGGMDGVEATARIVGGWPHPSPPPGVLVLTTFDLDEYVHGALHAGASGFLLKNSSVRPHAARTGRPHPRRARHVEH